MSKVIHADSSEFFRKMMRSFLSELGLESDSFERGADVINAINTGEASFVITGLTLADMGGEELIKRIIASSRSVPVIIVTSNDEAAQAKRLSALGVRAKILKSGNWKDELRNILG
ncbi:MAG: response regulator [Treponema sp.]|jgi:DNA-binding NarL/FixJ family response regulator|nr:response regulator [Treponema sp.]